MHSGLLSSGLRARKSGDDLRESVVSPDSKAVVPEVFIKSEEQKENERKEAILAKNQKPLGRIWALHTSWQKGFAIGVIFVSFLRGFAQLFCFLVNTHYNTRLQQLFALPTIEDQKDWLATCFYLVLFGGCLSMFVTEVIRGFFAGFTQSKLARTLRSGTFRKLLFAEAAFFDLPENRGGRLLSLLQNAAADLGNVMNAFFAALMQGVGGLLLGIVFALYQQWVVALIAAAYTTIIFVSGFPVLMAAAQTDVNSEANLSAVARSSECLSNIRAVRTVPGASKNFEKMYSVHVQQQRADRLAAAPKQALLYGAVYTVILNIQTVLYLTMIPIFAGRAFAG